MYDIYLISMREVSETAENIREERLQFLREVERDTQK